MHTINGVYTEFYTSLMEYIQKYILSIYSEYTEYIRQHLMSFHKLGIFLLVIF